MKQLKKRYKNVTPDLTSRNLNGAVYMPYIPLQITDLFMMNCELCRAPGTVTVSMSTPGGERYLVVCDRCEQTHGIRRYMCVFEYPALFPETNTRERDNIVWKIHADKTVYPLIAYHGDHTRVGLSKKPIMLTRDYYCHDDNLYELNPFPTSRLIGQPPYAYQFPSPIYDGVQYIVGFVTDGNYLYAHDVEFTDEYACPE